MERAKIIDDIKIIKFNKQQQIFVIQSKNFEKVNTSLYFSKSHRFIIKQYQYSKVEIVKVNN